MQQLFPKLGAKMNPNMPQRVKKLYYKHLYAYERHITDALQREAQQQGMDCQLLRRYVDYGVLTSRLHSTAL